MFKNQLTEPIPSSIGQLTSLLTLYVEGYAVASLMFCASHSWFPRQLYDNPMTGTMPSSIGLLTALQSL
jgi:hypothetical protein